MLEPDQYPTWPKTLQHLELANLQKLEADAASNMYDSLVAAASELPDLRFLSIEAHIAIPWRDRAAYRDQWAKKLRKVFLNKSPPPDPNLDSLKRYRLFKQSIADNEFVDLTTAVPHDDDPPHRRMSHIRITPRKAAVDYLSVSPGESEVERTPAKPRQPRRSRRVAESQSAASLSAGSGQEDEHEDESADLFVQGLCRVVDIRIDNQRPRETQYTEANFLGSELSGDEDWHSGAELEDEY